MEKLFYVTSIRYVESLLAREVEECGGKVDRAVPGGLLFRADLETAYKFCVYSRLASRLGLVLAEGPCRGRTELYELTASIPWDVHILPLQKIKFRSAVHKAEWASSDFASLVAKDSVADFFREKSGQRPIVDTRTPEVVLFNLVYKGSGWIGVDLHLDSLSKRGYRTESTEAPLRENTAAAVLMRSRWPYDFPADASFLDPMCGSGTLVIEAALMAAGRSPGMLNENLFDSKWLGHDKKMIEKAKAWNLAKEKPLEDRLFFGIDNDPNALSAARANAKQAGLPSSIKFILGDSTSGALLGVDTSKPGLAAVNPPYGQRMFKGQRLDELYASLGKALSDALSGWKLAVITEEGPLSRAMRLRPYKSGKISNGAIDCTISLFLLHGKDAKKTGKPVDEIADTEDWEALPGSEPEKAEQRDPSSRENKKPFPGTQLPEDLVNRLKKNIKTYAKLASKEDVECYRVYDRDLPDYAFAVDIYAKRNLVVQEYSAPKTVDPERAETRHKLMLKTLSELFPDAKIHEKTRRRQRGADQYSKQSEGGKFFAVNENGLKFYVNFTDYLDTGLFLDHRLLRKLIKDVSAGLSVLNLFSYTSSISICAAVGGANRTVSVDSSNTYCQWAERNFEINELSLENNIIERNDALKYLDECKEKFDIIVLDPPTFSNSKDRETILDIQADHRGLIEKCISLLNKEGVLYFSTNARRFKIDEDIEAKYKATDISKLTLGFDFERNRRAHVCYKIQRKLIY